VQSFFKKLSHALVHNYPELLHSMYVVNAPMFFDEIYDDAKATLGERTIKKIYVSSGSTHDELSDLVWEIC
jgi:hypothetical protein